MSQLPVPEKPYPDWSRFLAALWQHGMSVQNMKPELIEEHIRNATPNLVGAFIKRNEARTVRPSSFLACARQTYFLVSGEEPEPMPDNIGSTFAVGHLLHEVSYAAVRSALPDGFDAQTEVPVYLPKWWPADDLRFNHSGHVDLLLSAQEGPRSEYIAEGAPEMILVDFKTKGGFSYKKHGKTVFGEDADGFGYLAQLVVYADATKTLNAGAILAGINRDSLTQPLKPRFVEPKALKDELVRVKAAIGMALEGQDPGEEFLVRHGKEANFFCGRAGKPGYCAFKKVCKERETRDYE